MMRKNLKMFLMLAVVVLLTVVGGTKVQAGDITLKNGKWTEGTLTSQTTEQYYKINVKKTGCIKVEYVRGNKNGDVYAKYGICNSKKKLLVDIYESGYKSTDYIAVKKGTYYIYINDSAYDDWEEWDDEPNEALTESYKVKYTFTALKEGTKSTKPGKGLKKAPLLKKNKEVSGLIFQKKTDQRVYYKYTVSKKTKVKFNYEIMGTGGAWYMLRIADSKGKFLAVDEDNKNEVIKNKDLIYGWVDKGSDYVTLNKGTYYFVITANPGETGYYKLKLK